jgi:3-methyladenine DNA glycosylase AlkD
MDSDQFLDRLAALGPSPRMGHVFDLAKEFIDLPLPEVEKLLDRPEHLARAGAASIMDKQARRKKTPVGQRRALYELYLRRHDAIDSWDLVDLGCPWVVGGYLFDQGLPRHVLYRLARSKGTWERRTAIVSTLYFVRKGDVADTFALAEILVDDPEDLVRKAVGGLLREAGNKDRALLLNFLDRYAVTMPRVTLRYATERLDPADRKRYLAM